MTMSQSPETTAPLLDISDLSARPAGDAAGSTGEILRGLNLTVLPGEVHAIMGPNDVANRRSATPCSAHPNMKSLAVISSCLASRCSTTLQMSEQKPGCFSRFSTRRKSKACPSSSFYVRHSQPARASTFRSLSCDLSSDGVMRDWNGFLIRRPLPQRRFFRWRKEAQRDHADGASRT